MLLQSGLGSVHYQHYSALPQRMLLPLIKSGRRRHSLTTDCHLITAPWNIVSPTTDGTMRTLEGYLPQQPVLMCLPADTSPWASGNTAPRPFQMTSEKESRPCPQEVVQPISRSTSITIAPRLPLMLIQPQPPLMQDPLLHPHITNQFPRGPAPRPE